MFQNIIVTIKSYLSFYQSYLVKQWRDLTPETYVALLIIIAFVGWMMMHNSTKKI